MVLVTPIIIPVVREILPLPELNLKSWLDSFRLELLPRAINCIIIFVVAYIRSFVPRRLAILVVLVGIELTRWKSQY